MLRAMSHRLLAALLCALFALTSAPAATFADATYSIAAPRPAGQFVYGTHVSALDHAAMAHAAGFGLMWGYVPWQQVEPNRGEFLFRKQDQWGKPLPNALTNV